MSFVIRAATSHDISSLCDIISQLKGLQVSPQTMENRLQWIHDSPFDSLYVYEEQGSLMGLLGFRIRENLDSVSRYGEVSVLVVSSSVRRQGVGRSLMDFAEKLAKEHGCVGTWLVSGLGRAEEAHRFYQELGYQVTGYRFVKSFPSEG